jgi:succinate dehydrogenase / fumarate reductase cytochrome b subunit
MRADYVQATVSGRWMLQTGALLLLFVAVHIPHLTTGTLDAARFSHGAVYENLQRAFAQSSFAAFYLLAMLVLGFHLYHGAWSAFQSLGLDNPDRNRALRRMALVIAIALPMAFASVPIAFFVGAMDPPDVKAAQLGKPGPGHSGALNRQRFSGTGQKP